MRGRVVSPIRGSGTFPVVLFVAASLASCGEGRDSAPGSAGPIILQDSAVHVLGRSEAIGVVRDLEVLPNGSVWVLNSSAPFFLGFAADGRSLGVHGESGGGPFEYQLPSAFVTGGEDGEAWVFDYRRHALIKISEPAGDWSEIPIPRDGLPPGSLAGGMNMLGSTVRTARLGDEIVLARTAGAGEGGVIAFRMRVLRPDLMALDPTTSSVRRIVSLAEVMEDPTQNLPRTEGGFPLWYRLWTTCEGEELLVYDRVRDDIRVFRPDGTETSAIPIPSVDLSDATAEQIAEAVFDLRAAEAAGAVGRRLTPEDSVRVLKDLVAGIANERGQFAEYLPRYVDLRCGSDGAVWLHPFDPEEGGMKGGRAWLRVRPGGEAQEIRLPNRFDAFRFTEDQIWGVQRDEYDVASIAWIDMPLNSR
jgi:hypothetical protein